MGFVFYDVETSGLNPRFDQILQFAAIRTDDDLNAVEHVDLRCRLQSIVIPSPEALIVTRKRFEDLISPERPSHYDMVCQIHSLLLRWSPSVFVGFNSIKFDEEFLRQAFYSSLKPIFLTNTNGNARADVLRLVRAAAILHPDVLTVPLDNGRKTFRLSELARANGLAAANAHDALSDVGITLELCRLVRARAPELWSTFNRFSNKSAVVSFVTEEPAFGLFEVAGGHHEVVCVVQIGTSQADRNVYYCLDLSLDLDSMRAMSHEELVARLRTHPRPIHKLKANASPLLCHLWELSPEHMNGLAEQDIEYEANRVQNDAAFMARLTTAAAASEVQYPDSEHVEEQIYGGNFIDRSEWLICDEFHSAPWEQRLTIARRLRDPRLRTLARRLFLLERPDLLSPHVATELLAQMEQRVCEDTDASRWLTIPKALAQVQAMRSISDGRPDPEKLGSLEAYLTARLRRWNERI